MVSLWNNKTFDISHKSASWPHDYLWGFSVTATHPTKPIHLFIHIVKSFTQGEPDVFSPPALSPMKAAGLYRAGSKGLDGGNNTLYQLVKSTRGLSPCRMRLIPAPLARMSDETEILTWKQPDIPCEIGALSERQPAWWKTNVPPTCAWWSLATKIRHVA